MRDPVAVHGNMYRKDMRMNSRRNISEGSSSLLTFLDTVAPAADVTVNTAAPASAVVAVRNFAVIHQTTAAADVTLRRVLPLSALWTAENALSLQNIPHLLFTFLTISCSYRNDYFCH